MGKRGLPPKPTALRLLHGDRKDRINTDEPRPDSAMPECPREATADVREVWDYATRNLIAMGIATVADRDALMCYCEAVVQHRRASAILATESLLIEGYRGVLVRNPAVAMQRDAATVVRNLAREFGFTPSARSEIRTSAARGLNGPTGGERYLTG